MQEIFKAACERDESDTLILEKRGQEYLFMITGERGESRLAVFMHRATLRDLLKALEAELEDR